MKWFDIIKATATISTGPKKNRTVYSGSSAGQGVEQRREISRTGQMQLSNERTKREIDDAKVRLEDSKRKMEEAAKNDPRRDSRAYLEAQKKVQRDEEYLKRAEAQMIGPQNARRKPAPRTNTPPNTVPLPNKPATTNVPLPNKPATTNVPLPANKKELSSRVQNVLTRKPTGPPAGMTPAKMEKIRQREQRRKKSIYG